MDIPRKKIQDARQLVEDLENIKMIHYRVINPEIKHWNYAIGTEVHFHEIISHENIGNTWAKIVEGLDVLDTKISESKNSYSHYVLTKDHTIYRYSDHWGIVSSNWWQIGASVSSHGEFRLGVAHLSDFKSFIGEVCPERHKRINPNWCEKIKVLKPLVDELFKLKTSQEFKKLPIEDKKLIGFNYGLLSKQLKNLDT